MLHDRKVLDPVGRLLPLYDIVQGYAQDGIWALVGGHPYAAYEHGTLRSSVRYEPATKIFWDDELYRGDAYPGYAWAVYVAEVAVDLNTYMATVTRFDGPAPVTTETVDGFEIQNVSAPSDPAKTASQYVAPAAI